MDQYNTVGRRKAAIARVFMSPGTGQIVVNKKDYKVFFSVAHLRENIELPFKLTETEGQYDVKINVKGGGIKGQAEAVRLGISRCLVKFDEEHRATLKQLDLLTRDSKVVERKKPGLRKARKKTQFSKR